MMYTILLPIHPDHVKIYLMEQNDMNLEKEYVKKLWIGY